MFLHFQFKFQFLVHIQRVDIYTLARVIYLSTIQYHSHLNQPNFEFKLHRYYSSLFMTLAIFVMRIFDQVVYFSQSTYFKSRHLVTSYIFKKIPKWGGLNFFANILNIFGYFFFGGKKNSPDTLSICLLSMKTIFDLLRYIKIDIQFKVLRKNNKILHWAWLFFSHRHQVMHHRILLLLNGCDYCYCLFIFVVWVGSLIPPPCFLYGNPKHFHEIFAQISKLTTTIVYSTQKYFKK